LTFPKAKRPATDEVSEPLADDLLPGEEAQSDSETQDSTQADLAPPAPLGRGYVTPERRAKYDAALKIWCDRLVELKPRIELDPGVRGWCYVLEAYGLSKGDFDRCERLIGDCRKDGRLPLDFTTDDTESKWTFSNVEEVDDATPEGKAEEIADYVAEAEEYYHPISFWDFQDNYVEMTVEKSSIKKLFDPECARYFVPLGNRGGSWSINMRVSLLRRLAERQADGKKCVLLDFGDHDVHGLRMSNYLRQNLEAVLPAFRRAYPEYADFDLGEVEIERFGLGADFINKNKLTWIDGLITGSGKDLGDKNHTKNGNQDVQDYIRRFGKKKCEAEALLAKPQAGRNLCRRAIEKYIDHDGVDEFEQGRDEKREELREQLKKIFGGDE
jgi:hypothetical protein